jgi:hypothetical protein
MVNVYRRFEGAFCPQLQEGIVIKYEYKEIDRPTYIPVLLYSAVSISLYPYKDFSSLHYCSALKMDSTLSSEILVNFCQNTHHHISVVVNMK